MYPLNKTSKLVSSVNEIIFISNIIGVDTDNHLMLYN